MNDPRFVFPFGAVKKGANIVIYGGGVVGKTFLYQVATTNHCNVVAVCDRAPAQTGIQEVKVVTIPQLMKINPAEYETIVIANELESIAKSIRKDLEKAGITPAKIQWHDPARQVANKTVTQAVADRLPYLKGAESGIVSRPNVVHLATELLSYDVVSFDIFDTLILRPVRQPADIFRLMESKLSCPGFYNIRKNAEQKAREAARFHYGNTEVKLSDIWREVERRTGIPADRGMEAELEYEMRYCFANPYMKKVFDILIEQGKTVIIVSDMYLPSEAMSRLLEHVGYEGYERLYISCEYHTSKRSGGLWEYVKRDYDEKRIIHVGDNTDSDIQSAQRAGLVTRFYQNVHDMGNRYRTDGLSRLIESAYCGLVNVKLHSDANIYSPCYEYGYIYGGLYVFGFCQWIHRRAQEEGVEKIIFLSDNGAIFQKLFSELFPERTTEYLLWSGVCSLKCFDVLHNRANFLRHVVRHGMRIGKGQKVADFLERWGLGSLRKYMRESKLEEDAELSQDLIKPLEALLISHWDDVVSAYAAERQRLQEYVAAKASCSSKVAVIDTAWLGSNGKAVKYILEQECGVSKVYCWQAAHDARSWGAMETDILDETVESYMFAENYNRNCFDVHTLKHRWKNNMYINIFSSDNMIPFAGEAENGKYIFEADGVQRHAMIREIHQGILDFCRDYKKTFAGDAYLYNISGYDAYMPFRFISRDGELLNKYFSNI